MYVGGVEHAVLHLLYARFYTKFLYDIGVIDFVEPFKKLFNQGMICKDGAKMSKSKGNVVSPDELVRDYGCDYVRMYELFVGPPELDAEWNDRGMEGVYKFINRFYKLIMENKDKNYGKTAEMDKLKNKMIQEITERTDTFSFNTVISGFMENTNKITDLAKKQGGIDKDTLKTMTILIAPFAPHIAEELWEGLGETTSVFEATWPEVDENALKETTMEIVVQINGKVKAKINVDVTLDKDSVISAAKEELGDRLPENIVKEIYVPGKIVNIVGK